MALNNVPMRYIVPHEVWDKANSNCIDGPNNDMKKVCPKLEVNDIIIPNNKSLEFWEKKL